MNEQLSICNVTFRKAVLKTGRFKRKCRYHRIQGQEFNADSLFPKGFCPHAYRIAYPYCLSLLYDAKYPSGRLLKPSHSVKIKCPSGNNFLDLDISIRYIFPFIIRKLKVVIIRWLQFLNITAEYPDKNIILRVSNVNGRCPLEIREGQSFMLNVKDRNELCPASFYALYLLLMHKAIYLEGATGNDGISIHCPDPNGVDYITTGSNLKCENFFSIKADITEEVGRCPRGHKKGDSFKFEDILPEGFCPLAFYSIFPYYLTLIHSGNFEWVRKGESVKVQCPKSDGMVMEAKLIKQSKLGEGVVEVKIIGIKSFCPRGHKVGEIFNLNSKEQRLCFEALAALIPFKLKNSKGQRYACPGSENFLIFNVE